MMKSLLLFAASLPLLSCSDGDKKDPDAGVPDAPRADAPTSACTPKNGTTLKTRVIASGFDQPVLATAPIGDARIFVVEQPGKVIVVKDGAKLPTPFLNITSKLSAGGERGLLGMAFHPDFRTNGKFYVNYTDRGTGATVIAEYVAKDDAVDAAIAERRLIVIPQPFSNHNAGAIEFGIDGLLYIPLGDGGSGGDPGDRSQRNTELLGKVLRIDVNTKTGSKEYGIPPTNPFATSPDGANDPRPEIWQTGLRNPFRFAFDQSNGDIYLADVGQDRYEEISAGANTAGINWGWRQREGMHCFNPSSGCQTAGLTDPVVEHSRGDGWRSIVAGVVYRGGCFPDLVGEFIYTDFYINELWAFKLVAGAAQNDRKIVEGPSFTGISSIHTDGFGELLITRLQAGELLALFVE